jgi:hypothetical protein
MAQTFQRIAIKPKAIILKKGDWVVFPDPFGKHETRVGQVRGFLNETIEVGVMYTHFSPEVAGKPSKPVTGPSGKNGRMLNQSYFIMKEKVELFRK